MRTITTMLGTAAAVITLTGSAGAQELERIGISVGLLGNPFFVATIAGIEDRAREINPDVEITSVSADYDLNRQSSQIDSFIAAGMNIIMLNAVDAEAIAPAVQRAKAAGVVVAAFDVSAPGADVTVMTDNVDAGRKACQYIVDHLNGTGDVVIINGPQSSSIRDRVAGCQEVFSANSGINVLSSDQNGQGSRDGGLNVMQGLLTRHDKIDAVFAINDPTAIGAQLAARQLGRSEFIITGVDGAPDIEEALKDPEALIKASASQDPYVMAGQSLEMAYEFFQGNVPAEDTILLEPQLITSDNLAEYQGWTAVR
ncbi:substrate-binding domain-containing protein [Frigidibacter albus]|uniref:Substrate-binding domain-containing protein n=1 Tax=Frigidibacter albus TaxID=1465486 RepID=A0A6L8VE63_9RHOB|nr:ABC transporter substrate-binding protein [Frigidibacter albus]MZQ87619.1 substrate-binding domain-containing protein [Frigidibacter albus]NBE29525.1 substrate-binding domain-containing protein [Frigidibacter albus]GGH44322.1 LacI family transcriptional regulator [Frigidibacter albus]